MEKKVDMAQAGTILRRLRGIRTRTGVSKETGIPYSTMEAYENGTREPSGATKQKLANYYGVPVETIFLPAATTKRSMKQKQEA